MPGSESPLSGAAVLITRPGRQGASLASLVAEHGGQPVMLPLINIALQADSAEMDAAMSSLQRADLAIFVSVHAVDAVMKWLDVHDAELPDALSIAVIGEATRARLNDFDVDADIVPRGSMDSEGLILAFENGHRKFAEVTIFRAATGRERLARWLRDHGADVTQVTCYRRIAIATEVAPALAVLARAQYPLLSATSVELLDAMLDRLDPEAQHRITKLPLAVFSRRIHDAAISRGFTGKLVVARQPSNLALVEALEACIPAG